MFQRRSLQLTHGAWSAVLPRFFAEGFEGWGAGLRLKCIDCHAGGEPARVVVGGVPQISGTMQEKRNLMMQPRLDALRKLLLLEPRGYPCQNANFIFPPSGVFPTAAFGVVIAEQGARISCDEWTQYDVRCNSFVGDWNGSNGGTPDRV